MTVETGSEAIGQGRRTVGPEPGDRIVDFTRRDPGGRAVGFYETACGRATLLVVGRGEVRLPEGGQRTAVVRLLPPGDAPGPEAPAPGRLTLLDSDGAVTRHLAGAADAPATGFLLDPTLRVVATLPLGKGADGADDTAGANEAGTNEAARPEALARRLDALAWPGDGEAAAALDRAAPVLMVPQVLPAALCARLMAAHEADNDTSGMLREVEGRPALVADPQAKIRRDHRLRDPDLVAAVTDAFARRLVPELARGFYFPVRRFEALKVVRYDGAAGGHFALHRDNTTPDARHRRFALTLNLNTGDYEGGDLVFPEYGPRRHAPPAGGAAVFSCALLHGVRPVTRGRRYALITFFGVEPAAAS